MSRLPRPNVPVKVELEVALRQLGLTPYLVDLTVAHAVAHRQAGLHRDFFLELLADKIGCPVAELELDHDPALENREKLVELSDGRRQRTVIVPKEATVIRYFPDANDPERLFYRPHGPEFAGSHLIKTNVRGDRGQHSDRAMAAKNKNIVKNRDPKRRKAKIAQRKNPWPKKGLRSFGRKP
jgi:hypothetical protein